MAPFRNGKCVINNGIDEENIKKMMKMILKRGDGERFKCGGRGKVGKLR